MVLMLQKVLYKETVHYLLHCDIIFSQGAKQELACKIPFENVLYEIYFDYRSVS